MEIKNLPYFEDASEHHLLCGAAFTAVIANALALGSSTTAITKTDSQAKSLPSGVSISISRGRSFTKGTLASANVTTFGEGDIVVDSTRSTPNIGDKPVDVAHGVVVAIDLPRR
jgi:hypothetical protein